VNNAIWREALLARQRLDQQREPQLDGIIEDARIKTD
jgi:hypothetical protein